MKIPIVISLDKNYVPYIRNMLNSLRKATSEDKGVEYEIVVLFGAGTSKIMSGVHKIAVELSLPFTFRFMEIPKEKLEHHYFHESRHLTEAAYYRAFIPSILPEYSKALYVDVDLLFLESPKRLFQIDLKDNYLAAGPDAGVNLSPDLHAYTEECLGDVGEGQYFNSGVLLMNLAKMREDNFEEKFLAELKKIGKPRYHDQCILNIVCFGRVLFLDYGWNFQVSNMVPVIPYDGRHIKIVHYIGNKPWTYPNHPNCSLWNSFG